MNVCYQNISEEDWWDGKNLAAEIFFPSTNLEGYFFSRPIEDKAAMSSLQM